MAPSVALDKFQGPLDLLLQLIEQEKMAITDISVSEVTEQFFTYLNQVEEKDAEELADFLVVASKLVYLKSKHLLPYLYPDEETGPSLADQLKMYKRYADASLHVDALWKENTLAYGRIEPPPPAGGTAEDFLLPNNATAENLHGAFTFLLKRLKPVSALPQVSIDRTMSVKDKIASIYEALGQIKKLAFSDVISKAQNRTEVIVSFLAILELVKLEHVTVEQDYAFHNFILKKV